MLGDKVKKSRIYIFLERVFNDEVTKEDYYWHIILLFINIFLALLALSEIFFESVYHENLLVIHNIELIFGIVFAFEIIMRLFFIYLPNSVYFNWYIFINILVTLSLLFPNFIGNLAILRIIKSLKIVKIYKTARDIKKMNKEL